MKNIHILPTDKPSRLSILNSGKLNFGAEIMSSSNSKPQHIYITSDEEIKEDDWVIYNNKVFKIGRGDNELFHLSKKIILTTDQDLIKDGVQKIDDEFLEWFVKNPTCEKVEIRKEMYMPQSNGKISDGKITHEISLDPSQNTLPYYKIIIPKEESKQETLEKLAKKYYPDESKLMEMMERIAFKRGYTECKERMYSEEDMIEFNEWVSLNFPNQHNYLRALQKHNQGLYVPKEKLVGYYSTKELFEQFKKK